MNRDCCLWDGVKCDETSGQVIELDISCSRWGWWLIPIALSLSSRLQKGSTFLGITYPILTPQTIDDSNCILLRNVAGKGWYSTQSSLQLRSCSITCPHVLSHSLHPIDTNLSSYSMNCLWIRFLTVVITNTRWGTYCKHSLEFKKGNALIRNFCPRAQSSRICDYYGKRSYPKTLSWNMNRDYCLWDGVKCDETSGQVIELDIRCS